MRKIITHLLLIVGLGVLVYSNTLHVPFLWDDFPLIAENPRIRDLSNFLDFSGSRDLTYLSFALNYLAGGTHVAGFHIVNIFIHLMNALLIYFLVLTIFKTPAFSVLPASRYAVFLALAAGLIFDAHPVFTQTVNNINQRSVLLASFFYMLSVISFLQARMCCRPVFSRKHIIYYTVSLFSAVLAMKSKEISFTLPIVILVCERIFFPGDKKLKEALLYILPLFATMSIIPAGIPQPDVFLRESPGHFTIDGTYSALEPKHMSNLPRGHYLLTEARAVLTYLRLFFSPPT